MDFLIHIARAAETTQTSGGVVSLFGLDWKLFLAQLVNFGIAIFILWKWVFTPLVTNLQNRTKTIEQSLKTAEEVERARQEFTVWKTEEIKRARVESAELLSSAKKQAEEIKDMQLSKIKAEQAIILKQAKADIQKETETAVHSAKMQLADLVITASEKIIGKNLDTATNRKLVEEAVKGVAHD